jgi:hypothetical protein
MTAIVAMPVYLERLAEKWYRFSFEKARPNKDLEVFSGSVAVENALERDPKSGHHFSEKSSAKTRV